jgi:hypothetical protein
MHAKRIRLEERRRRCDTKNDGAFALHRADFGDLLRSSSPGKPLLTDKKHENSFLTVREALFGRDSVPL